MISCVSRKRRRFFLPPFSKRFFRANPDWIEIESASMKYHAFHKYHNARSENISSRQAVTSVLNVFSSRFNRVNVFHSHIFTHTNYGQVMQGRGVCYVRCSTLSGRGFHVGFSLQSEFSRSDDPRYRKKEKSLFRRR